MALTEQVISNLPSNMNHKKLNDVYKNCLYPECDKCEKLPESLPGYKGVKELCDKLGNNLHDLRKLHMLHDAYENERCDILEYWLNSELLSKYNKNNTVIQEFEKIWDKPEGEDKCKFNFSLYKEVDFNNTKNIHNFALDFSTMEEKIKNSNFKCSDDYKTYIKAGVQTYNNLKSTCESDGSSPLCQVFFKIRTHYGDEKLSKILCENLELDSLSPDPGEEVSEDDPEGDPARGQEHPENESIEDASPLSSSNVPIALIIPLLGIMLIIFILHKFTPLGFWFKQLLMKNKIIRSYKYEETPHDLLEYSHDNEIRNMQDVRHNIGYNSILKNSY
ncbi:PIR Superfamily Protein [Plasmodium ovale curtisi]|uniref:PIR Superfamily Protein n=1 Tax=Plasmodium ovale curtisi TaxID=864141 RepID=A0A1A8WBL7_PLAOA|nr:PIR Superfamily Protein [Plasmodium ovale curtisi]SBT02854.1 PIR Superfamily Protein [Plasmodium ovale curtisi]